MRLNFTCNYNVWRRGHWQFLQPVQTQMTIILLHGRHKITCTNISRTYPHQVLPRRDGRLQAVLPVLSKRQWCRVRGVHQSGTVSPEIVPIWRGYNKMRADGEHNKQHACFDRRSATFGWRSYYKTQQISLAGNTPRVIGYFYQWFSCLLSVFSLGAKSDCCLSYCKTSYCQGSSYCKRSTPNGAVTSETGWSACYNARWELSEKNSSMLEFQLLTLA